MGLFLVSEPKPEEPEQEGQKIEFGLGTLTSRGFDPPCPYFSKPSDAFTSRKCTRMFCQCANTNDCTPFKVAGQFETELSKVPVL